MSLFDSMNFLNAKSLSDDNQGSWISNVFSLLLLKFIIYYSLFELSFFSSEIWEGDKDVTILRIFLASKEFLGSFGTTKYKSTIS